MLALVGLLLVGCSDIVVSAPAHPVRTVTGDETPEGEDPGYTPPEDTAPEGGDTAPPAGDDTGASERSYTCLESVRNGSEICEDQAFTVPSPYQEMALVCVSATGGVGYVAANTGPAMSDGVQRCQGWEENGMNAWDHLDYIFEMVCTEDGATWPVDLRAWEGQGLWAGSHDHPDGGGHMNEICIAALQ